MRFDIITLFPEMFEGVFSHSIIKRAQEKKVVEISFTQLRDFAVDKHGTVDDKPYGGGTGMLLRPEPVFEAVKNIKVQLQNTQDYKKQQTKVILFSPRGQTLDQKKVRELAQYKNLILICPRYEGIDERVHTHLAEEIISIGNYVLSGAEIPAMVLVDAITRLQEGVLIKEDATTKESFEEGTLEHPQYTRPEIYEGLKVPEVLLSGNHKEIEKWKKDNSKILDIE